MTPPRVAIPGELRSTTLANGLRLSVLARPGVAAVSTALWYRVGARDEHSQEGGLAQFHEHMMFKGSQHFGLGVIDRWTQEVGGANNAFTSHDATVYHFRLPAAHWRRVLEIEADRMTGLALDPAEVDSERRVILEEISMYDNEPWDALEQQVTRRLYRGHAYGQPVLGTRASVRRQTVADLGDFHRRWYGPDNAGLVVVGDLDFERVLDAATGLAAIPSRSAQPQPVATPRFPRRLDRVERHAGEVARMLLAVPAVAAADPGFPLFRLWLALLTLGRSSRLHRSLVEERRLCLWVAGSIAEHPGARGHASLALELLPGVDPQRVEDRLFAELAALAATPPSPQELRRAQRLLLADWVFGHERTQEQALAIAQDEALSDRGWTERSINRISAATADDLAEAAQLFDPERGGVLGWSLPARPGTGRARATRRAAAARGAGERAP